MRPYEPGGMDACPGATNVGWMPAHGAVCGGGERPEGTVGECRQMAGATAMMELHRKKGLRSTAQGEAPYAPHVPARTWKAARLPAEVQGAKLC